MTDYREILRLGAMGFSKQAISDSCRCARNTVRSVLAAAQLQEISWQDARALSNEALRKKLFPASKNSIQYCMPDYEQVHKEMQKSGVTLSLLWVEYCEQCRANGEIPYQSTQFNKYYADYVRKTKATMHLQHKPGETMQVDWAGETMSITDTDTGERIPVYLLWPFCRIADMHMQRPFWTKNKQPGLQHTFMHISFLAAQQEFSRQIISRPVLPKHKR